MLYNYESDCYFCVTKSCNKTNQASIRYTEVPSVTKSFLHSKDLWHPVCLGNSSANKLDYNETDVEIKSISSDSDEISLQENSLHLINQAELNDLIWDIQFSRFKADFLAPAYNNGNYYYQTKKVTFFRNRSKVYSEEKVNIVNVLIS